MAKAHSQPNFKEMTNSVFDRLTVLGRGEAPYGCLTGQAFWRCKCSCGNIVTIRGASLRDGSSRSCGCLKRLEIKPGLRSGKLTVVGPDGAADGDSKWICRCDCGQTCIRLATQLKSSRIRSCGCLVKKRYGEAAENAVICSYKTRARRTYKLPFTLTKEETSKLFRGDCHYCGSPPSQEFKPHLYTHGAFIYNGIDRVDNKNGYISGNAVSCCWRCNTAKGARSYDEFISWLKRVAKKWGEG